MAKSLRTITVARLIELLEDESPDALVVVGADYGDISHTEQALPLKGRLETVTLSESAYSASGFAVAELDDDDVDDIEAPDYLVLR